MTFLFDRDTLPTGEHLSLGSDWNIGDKPNGGYTMAATARTMCAHTIEQGSQHRDPITVTTHYLKPAQPGLTHLDTTVLRTGRTFTTATGGMRQGEPPTLRTQTIATFGTLPQPTYPLYLAITPPSIPPPDDCVDRSGPQMFVNQSSIGRSTEIRLHPETGWIQGKPKGVAETVGWCRFRDGRPADPWALLYFADALPPTMFELLEGRSWVPTIELTVHVRAKPIGSEEGWMLLRMTTRHVRDGKFEEDGEMWDSAGQLCAQSRQLAMILPS